MKTYQAGFHRFCILTVAFAILGGVASAELAWWEPKLRVTTFGKQYVMSRETGGKLVYEGPQGVHYAEQQATQKAMDKRRAEFNARLTRFDEANLAIDLPRKGWSKPESSEEGGRTSVRLSRSRPEVLVSLLAEPVGIDANETNDTLLAASQVKMKGIPGAEVQPGVWKLSAPGIEGRVYRAKAKFEGGRQLHYSIWGATKNGYNYSLVVYGDVSDERAVNQTMQQFVSRVRQNQPNRVAYVVTEATETR